jgi:ADP-dependent phosphofructokinase/glucokinase
MKIKADSDAALIFCNREGLSHALYICETSFQHTSADCSQRFEYCRITGNTGTASRGSRALKCQ